MSRPTDSAIAWAFWELHEMQMDGFVDADAVIMMAEQFDNAQITTSPERVQIPAQGEHVAPYDRCPTCTAHMPVGKTCGGANCGLRGKYATE